MASVSGVKRAAEELSAKSGPAGGAKSAQPAAKRGRKPKVPAEVKLQPIKKCLNDHVKRLAKMVDDDWHDGYEEQEEEFVEYMCDLKAPFQAVYDVGIVQGSAYEACHEVLKCIADTWENMKTIPGRSCCEDMASNFETSHIEITLSKWGKGKMRSFMGAPTGALGYMWRLLLQSAAGNSKTTDEELFRYIKDATDFDIDILVSEDPDDDDEELVITEVDAHHKAGLERLTRLHSQEDKWNTLPTTKKVHRQRRCIDRRFDGPKHRRTRDYDSDSDGYGYGNTDAFMNIFAYALASGAFRRSGMML